MQDHHSSLNAQFKLLYATCKDQSEARLIGRALIDARLAACINILPQMESIYEWQGQIESSDEAVLIIKTTESLVKKASQRLCDMHSYETPCVLEISIDGGNKDFLDWMIRQTLPV